MQARAHAWERSLESMKVGIALYDREDRLMNCNGAFRALYPEIAHLFVPGARFYDVVTEYYKVAPAEVIDGRSLEQYLDEVGRRRSGSEVTEVVRHLTSLAADDRLPDGRRWGHQLPARRDRAKADRARAVQAPEADRRSERADVRLVLAARRGRSVCRVFGSDGTALQAVMRRADWKASFRYARF